MDSRHIASPRPKKFRVRKSARKVVASVFWYQDDIFLIDYLPQSQTNNTQYYLSLPMQLNDILKDKYGGKFIKLVLILHDNASPRRALATQQKLAYLAFLCLDHPPYSPDLARSVYHLFPGLKIFESSLFFVRLRGHYCRGDLVKRIIL